MRVKSSKLRPAAALAALLTLTALLFLALILSPDGSGAWQLGPGTGRVYAAVGNSFACASSTGLRVYGADGEELLRLDLTLESPALSASGDCLALWDLGGRTLYFSAGPEELVELDAGGALASARVGGSGVLAAVTLGGDGRGAVTVYGPSGEVLYRWHAGTVWPLDACVSPDGDYLAVLAASELGGEVRVFDLGDTREYASFSLPGELLFDLGWMDGERLCAVSADRAVFLTRECEKVSERGFGELEALDCGFGGDGFALIELGGGGERALLSLDAAGEELGYLELDSAPLSVDARGDRVLLLAGGEARLLDSSLSGLGGRGAEGAVAALLSENGGAVLVRRDSARAEYI